MISRNQQHHSFLSFTAMTMMAVATTLAIPAAAQTAAADNIISESITWGAIPAGPAVEGVFQGRTPCLLAAQWQLPVDTDCEKVKLSLTLYKDPVTDKPTHYKLQFVGAGDVIQQAGGNYRGKTISLGWSVRKGLPGHPLAIVYCLQTAQPANPFYLLKGDDNVLFILDSKMALLTGNADYSFTLNRVRLVAATTK
jgi:hypothetical protein